ncbi:MAG TPA: glycoside hydrolase family 75 protein [Terriglobales bacterium]
MTASKNCSACMRQWLNGSEGVRLLPRRERIWKQLSCTLLLAGLLCTPRAVHAAQTCGQGQFEHLQSSYNALVWNHLLAEGLHNHFESAAEANLWPGQADSCGNRIWMEFVAARRDGERCREVPVWRLADTQVFFFIAGMTIDADGAPNAYHPDDLGLDELANAGNPAHWDGIITDQNGNPIIQQESDPFPGYYVSCTTLADSSKPLSDPRRFVDASQIPYVVLPNEVAERGGARLGDFAFVMNLRNGRSSFAIYADIGTLGEGSIALAQALGIHSDARVGGTSDGILYVLFPGSGDLTPRAFDEVQNEGEKQICLRPEMRNLFSCAEGADEVAGNRAIAF